MARFLFVVPPLTFAEESCEVMAACIEAGLPVLLLSAGQAGATAHGRWYGSLRLSVAVGTIIRKTRVCKGFFREGRPLGGNPKTPDGLHRIAQHGQPADRHRRGNHRV